MLDQVRSSLRGYFSAFFATERFFSPSAHALEQQQGDYIDALLSAAGDRRPVLQFCRSSGRMRAMRSQFPGVHFYLWRELRTQWRSYKVTDYFDQVTQRIGASAWAPEALVEVRGRWGVDGSRPRATAATANYAAVYALWHYSKLEASRSGCVDVCIDSLCANAVYRRRLRERLAEDGLSAVDFDSCRLNMMAFSEREDAFYRPIEAEIGDIFVQGGEPAEIVHAIMELPDALRQARARSPSPFETELRMTALRLLDDLARRDDAIFRLIGEG